MQLVPGGGKMLVCLERDVISLYECGTHVTSARPPQPSALTPAQKEFANQMTSAGLKPARIRILMLAHFNLRPSELPPLQKVQNVVCYYRRTKLGGSDTTSSMVAAVRGRAFNGEEDEAFSFGWDVDRDGAFVVGNGSDEKPFLVGLRRKLCCDKLTETPVPLFSTWMLPTRRIKLVIL
ncbi:hypothetical protein F442_20337 [Phytophthora nicotianae P10297]|uniref:Uncharacterized protein n=2 Tax=Phytophthora nicotianae TaxID=4792 RepID=W2Y7Q4_PHYNI|nr:hypothetical protein F442_20337 [Phytophthora nicotianae P10297]